jgi:hypothetical protein
MQASAWKDFLETPYYGKFRGKFDGKAELIVGALEKRYESHYSKEKGFDGFFDDCFRLETEGVSDDRILETMREKAEETLFKQEIEDLAKARGIGEKGLASILGGVYTESADRQKHLMRNYLKLREEGADRQKMENLIMERYGPNHMKLEETGNYIPETDDAIAKMDGSKDSGSGSSWWKKYGRKARNWGIGGIAAAVAAGLIVYTCNVKKLGDYETKQQASPKIEEKIQAQESASLCPPGFSKLSYVSKEKEVILPMPEDSQKVGLGNNYKVVIRGDVQCEEDGSAKVRIRQRVKPGKGVDAIGILSKKGWVCGKPGEYITVELTQGELGKYNSGEGVNFQVAALQRLSDGVYQSMGSYRNLFVKK